MQNVLECLEIAAAVWGAFLFFTGLLIAILVFGTEYKREDRP